jgi:hypothetical protein
MKLLSPNLLIRQRLLDSLVERRLVWERLGLFQEALQLGFQNGDLGGSIARRIIITSCSCGRAQD